MRRQVQLAERLGIHQATVSKLLRGARGVSVDMAVRIERATSDWPEGPIRVEEWAEVEAEPEPAPTGTDGA